MNQRAAVRTAVGTGGGAGAVVVAAAIPSTAAEPCEQVRGTYVEHAVSGPECTSTVGLCIAGTYSGGLRRSFSGQATSVVPTTDTPQTSVALFTSTSTITTSVRD